MKFWLLLLLGIGLVIGGVYWYYTNTQDRIEMLIQQNVQWEESFNSLEAVNNQNVDTIKELRNLEQLARNRFENLQMDFRTIERQNQEFRNRLGEHNLGELAYNNPELVESIINNASDNAARCFELLSGSPLTLEEQNAESARDFNSECPWIYDFLNSQ